MVTWFINFWYSRQNADRSVIGFQKVFLFLKNRSYICLFKVYWKFITKQRIIEIMMEYIRANVTVFF